MVARWCGLPAKHLSIGFRAANEALKPCRNSPEAAMVIPIKSFAQAQKKAAINERKCDLQTAATTRAHLKMETGIQRKGEPRIFPEIRANRCKPVHSPGRERLEAERRRQRERERACATGELSWAQSAARALSSTWGLIRFRYVVRGGRVCGNFLLSSFLSATARIPIKVNLAANKRTLTVTEFKIAQPPRKA